MYKMFPDINSAVQILKVRWIILLQFHAELFNIGLSSEIDIRQFNEH